MSGGRHLALVESDRPEGAETPPGRTHSSDFTREGLAMKATRVCDVDNCDRPLRSSELCGMHWDRFRRNGSTDLPARPSLVERIRRLTVEEPGQHGGPPCWTFIGMRTEGYGRVRVGGARLLTHRVMWEALVGPIDPGLQIDHLCRNRACCNPAHLEPVTPQINQRRGMGFSGINARKTHCPRGHDLSGDNLYMTPNGARDCRQCRAIASAAHKARRREKR